MTARDRQADSPWRGRVDADGGLRWHQVIEEADPATAGRARLDGRIALIGYACDDGVARNQGRTGAASGPRAIRGALAALPAPSDPVVDLGDISGGDVEDQQSRLADAVARGLEHGALPLALGGGHDIAYGTWSGLARHLAASDGNREPSIGIVNFDAHFDLRRESRRTSGTPFLDIAMACDERGWPFDYLCLGISEFANTPPLFETARERGVDWLSDEALVPDRLDAALARVGEFVAGKDAIYLTFCLDALPGAVAPGVSAPSARGVELAVVEPLIDAILDSGKLAAADLAEMNPRFDVDGRTARVAARLAARIARRRTEES